MRYYVQTLIVNGIEKQFLYLKLDDLTVQFPPDLANSDYQRYLAWLEEGNIPELWNEGGY